MSNPIPNTDEGLAGFIGNFHKTLPHDEYGVVDPDAYLRFRDLCGAIESGVRADFESVPRGTAPPGAPFAAGADMRTAALTSPLTGAAQEGHGPDPRALEMPPAPGFLSASTAAEMVELYWMAALRDKPLLAFQPGSVDTDVGAAVAELGSLFASALAADGSAGALALVRDLPASGGALDLNASTLFRCGLQDEEHGPLINQFFLRDIPYGTHRIDQSIVPYAAGLDHLITYGDWLRAQNTGKDVHGRDYGQCNFYADPKPYYATTGRRKVSTMRDLARFVNRDALHQAYFNAALFLDATGAPVDAGNPYHKMHPRYTRQGGFATLGGPDLLTLVSEVASRALKVVWRQKWLVHRRARPEVYAGLIEMQRVGPPGKASGARDFGLPASVVGSEALNRIHGKTGTSFLPMAYSAGSPSHPAYGAGHATVAGACVTVLKAWFDESTAFQTLLCAANNPLQQKEPPDPPHDLDGATQRKTWLEPAGAPHRLLQPGAPTGGDTFGPPSEYSGTDDGRMTVGGELNKLASNVAMGRSMGGVHWRSDNTRSLRLGEAIAIEILRKRTAEYAEKAVSFTFTSFDRKTVHITGGTVTTT